MNLIDRDRLIEVLNRNFYGIGAVEVLKQLIEAQPIVNQWIPCKEELPPKPLFSWDGYIVQEHNVEEPYSAYWNGEKWIDDEDNEIEGIIAWQPLPERYKGDQL